MSAPQIQAERSGHLSISLDKVFRFARPFMDLTEEVVGLCVGRGWSRAVGWGGVGGVAHWCAGGVGVEVDTLLGGHDGWLSSSFL